MSSWALTDDAPVAESDAETRATRDRVPSATQADFERCYNHGEVCSVAASLDSLATEDIQRKQFGTAL